METTFKIQGGFTKWESENFRSEDGGIYGIPGGYYEVHNENGVNIGEVTGGEYKATEKQRKSQSNGKWWAATRDGQLVGKLVKSRAAALQILLDTWEEPAAKEETSAGMTAEQTEYIEKMLQQRIKNLEYHAPEAEEITELKATLSAFNKLVSEK